MEEKILVTALILARVAFFTLAERKIIAINHNRKGPNKANFKGVLQPIRDAGKLVTKEWKKIKTSNKVVFIISPCVGLASYIMVWIAIPNSTSVNKINMALLYLTALLSTTIIFAISTGWSSNRKFTILGRYRSTAQAISYEISIAIFMLAALTLSTTLNIAKTKEVSIVPKMMIVPFIVAWIITILAETRRTPFDFTERESELVSGFNTEYYGSLFSVFFIAEYLALIFIASLTTLIITERNTMMLPLLATGILILITSVRITLPRSRYDKLMSLAWLTIMPASVIALSLLIIVV